LAIFDGVGIEERAAVTGYNRDDCLSAWRLRDWLEKVRSELVVAPIRASVTGALRGPGAPTSPETL
jgi:hypothetical protein